MTDAHMIKKKLNLLDAYILTISISGFAIILAGVIQIPSYEPLLYFALLAALACVAQLMTTTVPVGGSSSITFEVGNAVAFAAIPLLGPIAAATIFSFSFTFLWLIKRTDESSWKRSWRQLGFNMGMSSVAMYMGGLVFYGVEQWLDSYTLIGPTVPWLVAALAFDQVNFWLLFLVLYLQSDSSISPREIWRENQWAMPINVLITSAGGGLLAYAAMHFNWIGIVIFFLPGFLSATAFRLYVRKMKKHMQHLEEIVANRTQELSLSNSKLHQINQELEDHLRNKVQLIDILSHDIRTPLTTIGLYSGMLERQAEMPKSKRQRMASVIKLAQVELNDMVTNILDSEGIQTGQREKLKLEDVDVKSLIRSAIQAVGDQAEAKDIAISSNELEVSTIHMVTDKTYVKRLINNLLTNSIKYTPIGGKIQIHLQKGQSLVKLSIHDNGYGIPEEEQQHIFEPYRRVSKHADRAHGTGLGLSIVKNIIEILGGQISVKSTEGVGSTFIVELPLNQCAVSKSEVEESASLGNLSYNS